MEQTQQRIYKDFKDFYFAHLIPKGNPDKLTPTHTRIGDKTLNIFAGSLHIPNEELLVFHQLYYDWIFVKGNCEHLTEKQMTINYKMVVDLDFRYSFDVETRQHNKDDIEWFVSAYCEELKKYLIFTNETSFNIWVCEKPNVNRLEDGSLTKDGIHLVFDLAVPYPVQLKIRANLIAHLSLERDIDLPLTNSWDSVFDDGISKGSTNWQLFGSQKPNNQAYQVTHQYKIGYDETDGEITMEYYKKPKFDFETFQALSVQTQGLVLELKNPDDAFDQKFKPISPSPTSVANLHNVEQQQQQVKTNKYEELLEIIGQGSKVYKILHPMWFQIGSILKTNGYDKSIFQNFTEQFVPNKLKELDKIWECIHMTTVYSIFILQKMAKEINLTGYNIWFIKHKEYISIKTLRAGNNDIAKVISDRLKDELVYCNKMWILFDKKTNLWRVTDAPQTKVCNFIQHLIDCSLETLMYKINRTHDDDELKILDGVRSMYGMYRCCMADNKENSMIVKLLRDYLYDKEFCSKLDVNIYKVAYKNGILDLKTLEFREGLLPSDMLTQTIPYNYEKASKENIAAIRFEILKICNYNETHLDYYLSALGYAMTGDSIKLQEFYYIIGQKASNGKSVIFEALNDIIPCYSNKIESSAFELKNSQLHKEIATWKGLRIGWINELTKNKQDAEIIKQVADGTSIKYKVMYGITDSMPITFKPFIISNHSITIDADEGIARRVKLFQMDSEFIDGLEVDNFETCQFKRDNNFGIDLRTKYKFALMDLIYSYSYKFAQTNKLSTYPADWNEEKKNCLDDNNVFAGFVKTHFEFDATYEISEYSLKNYLKQNKFENVKFRDEAKKNKWNIKRNNEGKKWVGLRIKDEIEE